MPEDWIDIDIHTFNSGVLSELMGTMPTGGASPEFDRGIRVKYRGHETTRSATPQIPDIIMFAVSVPTSLAAGLFVHWLWEKLKGRSIERIEIDRTTVEFSEGEITRIFQERISGRPKDVEGV